MFKRSIFVAAAIAVSGVLVVPAPAGADVPLTVLGTDAALDAPPGGDLTQLAAGVHGSDLHIQFTFANSIPAVGTYGPPAGVQWAFKVKGKTFVAEAYPDKGDFGYVLFEIKGDTFTQVATLKGEWDTIGGVLDIFVPLKNIGAGKGTKIAGAGKDDADVHVHGVVTTFYADRLTTTKGIVVR